MAKIVWSVPLLQYGKFLIEATPEELGVDIGSPHSMAMAYAVYAQLAAKGYDEGLKIDVDTFIGKPGNVTDRYKESPEPTPEQAESEIKDQLGATTVEPWTKTPAPSTTPKAWDNFDI